MIVITGGTSGTGLALANAYRSEGSKVLTIAPDGDIKINFAEASPSLAEAVVAKAVSDRLPRPMDLSPMMLIHCAGVNHIEHDEMLTVDDIERLMLVNAYPTFWITRALRPMMKGGIVCAIVSDAAWTPMTGSLAYNASKAAQHMIVRQMAHEWRDLIIFGVAPGKIAGTKMSAYIDEVVPIKRGWTPEKAREYQLSKLRTGEMRPETVANFIMALISHGAFYGEPPTHLHGHIVPFGG